MIRSNFVDNTPLRERYLRTDMTAGQVAELAGMYNCKKKHGDTTRLLRALGLRPETSGNIRSHVTIQTAWKIGKALGLDPVDMGF